MTVLAKLVSAIRSGRCTIINSDQKHEPLPRHLVRHDWAMPSFDGGGILDPSMPEYVGSAMLHHVTEQAVGLWNEGRLPIPFAEMAYLFHINGPDGPVRMVLHALSNPAAGTITLTPYQLYPGEPWITRMYLTARQGTQEVNLTLWSGQPNRGDADYGNSILYAFTMTYLLVKAPQDAISRTVRTSATLNAVNRKLPRKSQIPATQTITIDLGRLARRQAPSVPSGRTMPGHNRRGHMRRITWANGTIDEVPVKPCQINGGGPDRDYEVKP